MRWYTSLRWRLTWLIAGGSAAAAAIAAAGFSAFDLHRFWQRTYAEVSAVAAIVADQVSPAIMLEDRRTATEILRSLSADTLVDRAILYDGNGGCFAMFSRMPVDGCPAKAADGFRREPEGLLLAYAVTSQGDRLGTLVLTAHVPSVPTVLRQYVGGAGLIFLLSLVVAAVVAMSLQRRVTAPILRIARVAEQIARTHRFNDRVEVSSSDELGLLAGAFNSMSGEIERRDAQLELHRLRLEEQVEERNRVNAELRIAKEKAESAALLKSQFLANVSHEIRTPMNGVVGMISLVLERCTDSEEREQLTVAQTAAQSLVSLLNDILDLSKMEAGKMTVEVIDFDLRTVLRSALQIFELPVRDKNLTMSLDLDPACPVRVHGDPVRLRQVLTNLVGNAVKFTAAGGVGLDVRATYPGRIRFSVQDTGIGIPPDKRDAVFEAFTQADGSHTRRFGGTGLGLTITRKLVRLLGGDLQLDSQFGHGSTFFFELPLPASHAPAAVILPLAETGLSLHPLHVLVAEDNAINQRVIDAMLRRQGWSVTLAANGIAACEQFERERFDLLLMDVQMPEMDGLEATRRIRGIEQQRGLQRTPVIALTAHASDVHREQCLAAGMDAVITKPVNRASLLRGIAASLPSRFASAVTVA